MVSYMYGTYIWHFQETHISLADDVDGESAAIREFSLADGTNLLE